MIAAERAANRFVAGLGARKMWLRLRSKGHDVARCTVERLMGQMGVAGVTRGSSGRRGPPSPTRPPPGPRDLVDRHFAASTAEPAVGRGLHLLPDLGRHGLRRVRLRRVLPPHPGLARRHSMTTPLVLDCLEQAIWTRQRDGASDLSGLVHHTDAGSQYTSIAFTDRLVEAGIDPSVGSVGDAYDNALAESQIGLFKSELIWPHGPWRDRDHLEAAVLDWVTWFNTERPHESIDDLTPVAAEELHYRYRAGLAEAG